MFISIRARESMRGFSIDGSLKTPLSWKTNQINAYDYLQFMILILVLRSAKKKEEIKDPRRRRKRNKANQHYFSLSLCSSSSSSSFLLIYPLEIDNNPNHLFA